MEFVMKGLQELCNSGTRTDVALLRMRCYGSLLGVMMDTVGQECFKDGDALKRANTIVELMLKLLNEDNDALQEEVVISMGTFVRLLREDFKRYLVIGETNIFDFLLSKISGDVQIDQPALTRSVVGLIGAICMNCGESVAQFCDKLVQYLLKAMQSDDVDLFVKPVIVATLGDIGIAIKLHFARYLEIVMNLLFQAGNIKISDAADAENEDMIEGIIDLRAAVLESCSSILAYCIPHGEAGQHSQQYLMGCLQLVQAIMSDTHNNTEIRQGCLELVYDIGKCLPNVAPLQNHQVVQQLIQFCSNDPACAKQIRDLKSLFTGQQNSMNRWG